MDGNPAEWRYYGMVIDSAGFMRGCADLPGYVGSGPTGTHTWGWDSDGSYGDWYGAHELGHTYNRGRANFCDASGGPPYPYPNGIIGGPTGNTMRYYGWDVENRTVIPHWWVDLMTYCDYEWVSDFTYNGIRSRIASEAAAAAAASTVAAEEYVAVFGHANLMLGTATLDILYRLRGIPAPEPPTPSREWAIALLDAGGKTLANYPFTPKEVGTGPGEGPEPLPAISETVPWANGTARVAILYNGVEVAGRDVSANAPVVHVIYPNGGENLTGPQVTVQWSGSDADGDSLVYAIQYSADAGGT